MSLMSAAGAVLVAAIAWGAFAFGAVYPWAYWPLVVAALVVAAAGLFAPASVGWRQLGISGLSIALAVFLVACVIQIVPLPWAAVEKISPAAPAVIAELDVATRQALTTSHALSIEPPRSVRGLAVIGSFALLVIGATRLFSIIGVAGAGAAIAAIGAVLALTGIIHEPLYTGKIYGFWSPLQAGADPFGPFVNRNHFAGWMVMGLPVTLGLLSGHLARGLRGVGSSLRERVLWLSSADASRLLLLVGAVAAMTLSLIMTMSRSGISAAIFAIAVFVLLFRRHRTRARRIVAVATVTTLVAVVVAWAGTAAIATRFSSAEAGLEGRVGAWGDAWRIARLYPMAGTGLNTYAVAMHFHQQFDPSKRYPQAHNDYLQLAAEGGMLLSVPAALCIAVFVGLVIRRLAQEEDEATHWIRMGSVVGLAAIALQETADFSLQMPGNALLFGVLCAIALHRAHNGGREMCA